MEPSIDYKPSEPNLKWYLIITVLVVLLIISVGWNLYSTNRLKTVVPEAKPPAADSSLFDTQSANFSGKITAVSSDKLTVKNKKGVSGEIVTDSKTIISRFLNPPASSSSDLKTIETDKDVMINLQVKDGRYVAVSITYVSAPPPANLENASPSGLPGFPPKPPPPSTPSAQPRNNE